MKECVFCQVVDHKAPAFIVYEDADRLAFLDLYPQTRGHLQLIPKKHYQWLYEIPDMDVFFNVAGRIIRVIIPVLGADHVTIASFGRQVAHAHLWIVPQYRSDRRVREGERGKVEIESQEEVGKLIRKVLKNL